MLFLSAQLSKEKIQAIERKRLEAKAKLEAKKKQQDPVIPTTLPEVSDCKFISKNTYKDEVNVILF